MIQQKIEDLRIEASDPATSVQRLEELCTDPHLRVIVAGNPSTPANLLATLARHQNEKVRQAVSGNANTPWLVLEQLAWEFPRAFLTNPAGQFYLTKHPEQIRTDEAFWGAILREASIPFEWWSWLLHHPTLPAHQMLRLHILQAGETAQPYGNPQETDEDNLLTLTELLTAACVQGVLLPSLINNSSVSQATTSGEQFLVEHLQRLAHSSDVRIRAAVASNQRTPAETLQALTLDQDMHVRQAVAENPKIAEEILRILALDDATDIRQAMTQNAHPQIETLYSQTKDQDQQVYPQAHPAPRFQTEIEELLLEKEWRENLRQYFLYKLGRDRIGEAPIELQLEQIASLDIPDYTRQIILATLANDWDGEKIQSAFNTPGIASIEGLRTRRKHLQLLMAAFMSPNALQKLATSPAWEVRYLVVLHRQTPWETRRCLARDGNRYVRALAHAKAEMIREEARRDAAHLRI